MPSHLLTLATAVHLGFGTLPPTASNGAETILRSLPDAPAATNARHGAGTLNEDPPATRIEAALQALAKHVGKQSHPDALRLAFRAYYSFRASNPEKVRKPYLYFVDYGLENRAPRGYVFDMEALKLVDGPFTVAHGRGSSGAQDGVPTRFTNTKDSATSSLGLYLAQETYAFGGKTAGRRYRSVGLRLHGLSGRFNSAARTRGIVVHGAPYVTSERAGRSEGCPAMEESRAQTLIPRISNGGLVFLFSPLDAAWMREDPWTRDS